MREKSIKMPIFCIKTTFSKIFETSRNLNLTTFSFNFCAFLKMSLERQVRAKLIAKRDPAREAEAKEWMESVLEKKLPTAPFEDTLKDGTILCELMNKIKPGCITKINTSGGQFKMFENINK